jgi:hypothetical protein
MNDIPVRVHVTPLHGVVLPDGTPVDNTATGVIGRVVDELLDHHGIAPAPDHIASAITRLLSAAKQDDNGRWNVDVATYTTNHGVATVQLVAEHDEALGWVARFDVPPPGPSEVDHLSG